MDKCKILSWAVRIARATVLDLWSPTSCIISAKMINEIAKRAGFNCSEMPAAVIAFNGVAVRHIESGVPLEQAAQLADAWSVGIGVPHNRTKPGCWNGHLVNKLEWDGDTYLVDASLDQISRPQYAMNFTPVVLPVDCPEFWGGREERSIVWADGSVVAYQITSNDGYAEAPDWMDERRFAKLEDTIEACVQILKIGAPVPA